MRVIDTNLGGLKIIKLSPFEDERGKFARLFDDSFFQQQSLPYHWKQINHSYTKLKGTIRGLHFQHPPHEEVKMIKCLHGTILDVAVDLRPDSPTFLQHYSIELSENDNTLIVIPEGFAHGFQSLTDDCVLLYFHSQAYTPGSEGGLRHDDPKLKIDWPLPVTCISERDQSHSFIKTL